MTELINSIYFPASVPRYRHAALWRCLETYDDAELLPAHGRIKIVRYLIKAAADRARGKKIIFFSDLHYSGKEKELVLELAGKIKQLSPDLILCGGDFTANAAELKELPECLEILAGCSPLCITVPGNWERGKEWLDQKFWHSFFAGSRWHYLCNESMPVEDWGWVYGSDDNSRGNPDVLELPPEKRQNILLVHRPDTVVYLDWERKINDFHLAVCGHTHGGQIRLPFIGALTAPSFYRTRFTGGVFARNDSDCRMIVSTGVHHASFPWRFNCRREVILLEFQ